MTITDSDVSSQLSRRAATVQPRRPSSTTIASRSRRLRHRHLGVGVAAVSLAGVLGGGAIDHAGDPTANVDAAASGGLGAPTLSPLRIGLGASPVVSAMDGGRLVTPPGLPGTQGVLRTYENPTTDRSLIISSMKGGTLMDVQLASPPPSRKVDLGNGQTAELTTYPLASGRVFGTHLIMEKNGGILNLDAKELTDDEMIAVARTTSVVDAGAGFDAQDVPADLVAGPEAPPSGPVGVGSYGGVRNMVYYRWSDPIDIEVDVFANDGGEQFRHDLAAAKASPNPDRSVAAVRGRDAIVRRTYTTVGYGEESTITWLDPTGHLVQIRIMPKQAGAVPDPDAVIASVRELDETEFQAMVARADQTPVRHG